MTFQETFSSLYKSDLEQIKFFGSQDNIHIETPRKAVKQASFWRKSGFSIIGGYWSRRHLHAVCFSEFSAMLDLYMGGCQAAPGPRKSCLHSDSPFISKTISVIGTGFFTTPGLQWHYHGTVRDPEWSMQSLRRKFF